MRIVAGVLECLKAFCVGFLAVFSAKMLYYAIRDRK